MRRSERVAVRATLLLAGVGVVAAVAYFSGWLTMARNVVVLGARGTSVVGLAKRTPFTPPAGEGVSEPRLKSYLEVCRRIKPFGDKVDAWEAEHAKSASRGKGEFKGRAAGLVGDYLRAYQEALEVQGMGPVEFAWIEGRMRRCAKEDPGPDAADASDRALYVRYRDELEAAALGPHAREIALGFAE